MISKEIQKMEVVQHYRLKRAELRKILKSQSVSQVEKMEAREKMDRLPRRSMGVRVVNRCQITGRSRGYIRKFQMSRIAFQGIGGSGNDPWGHQGQLVGKNG